MPATLYGEYDDFDVDTAHVCGALVGKFVKAMREGADAVEVWGDGSQVRDFLYVGDFVGLLMNLMPKCNRDFLNVSHGTGTSIRKLAETIQEATGFEGQIIFNINRYVGDTHKVIDSQKLKNKYGLIPEVSLIDGIQKTVDWYQSKYESVKDVKKFH